MSYDNTCKFLAETFPTDFASWLLGEPIALTKLEPSELSVEPIRADSVIFLESTEIILHLEFQTEADKNIPFRMADYKLRLYRKFPERQIHQVVIYLNHSNSSLVFETEFNHGELTHKYNVIRIWEQLPEILQKYQGLLPFAALAQTDNPEETLRKVAKQIDDIEDKNLKSNLTTAAYIFSGLVLDKEIIRLILRSEIMKESVTYQEILLEGKVEGIAEGEVRGIAKGLVEGKVKAANQIALNMLHSEISIDLIAQFTGLTIEHIRNLEVDRGLS
jgi:predicted transposase/invertase (TIGR01784 family)